MATKVKTITPKKLNVQAMQAELVKIMSRVADTLEEDFKDTTKHWDHKVSFDKHTQVTGSRIVAEVQTDDEIYGYVVLGTRPHVIEPKKAGGVLAFPSAFSPKTTPGSLATSAGSKGGPTVISRGVFHPGNKPRNLHKLIAEKRARWFRDFEVAQDVARLIGVERAGVGAVDAGDDLAPRLRLQ